MTQKVKIRYHWRVRLKLLLHIVVLESQRVIRPVLRWYDRAVDWAFFSFKAEGYDDLTLGEWLRVKQCEWRGRHIGQKISLSDRGRSPSAKYCNACQCDWQKFSSPYDANGKRIAHRST